MKKLFFIAAMAMFVWTNAQAQNMPNDSVAQATLVKTGGNYILGNRLLTEKQVGLLYQQQCPEAYKKFQSAKACIISGSVLVGLGGLEIVGVSAYYRALNSKKRTIAYSVGTIVTCSGLITMLCAPLAYSKAVDIYNDKIGTTFTFQPYIGASEVGVAVRW